MPSGPTGSEHAWKELVSRCAQVRFEPHDIAANLDARGKYEMPLDREFAFALKLFHYSSQQHTRGATWHERLELFVPLDGRTLFRMGDRTIELAPGDLLVVENLTLHHVVDFAGFDTRAIVVSFRPEFVYSLGSPSYDYAFLLPFYTPADRAPRLLPLQRHPAACHAIRRLIECRFGEPETPLRRAGCKAFLLQLLYELGAHFPGTEAEHWNFIRHQQRALKLKVLFDHVRANYAERLSVFDAARLVGMSQPQFMKTFKKVAGTTLVGYVNHVRLSVAAQLLRESDSSIAEIASRVGFSDQSYFDKRFKRAFGRTPRDFRLMPRR